MCSRTKDGKWVTRSREVQPGNGEPEVEKAESEEEEDDDESSSDNEEEKKAKQPVSVVDILAKRRVLLAEAKVQVKSSFKHNSYSTTSLFVDSEIKYDLKLPSFLLTKLQYVSEIF